MLETKVFRSKISWGLVLTLAVVIGGLSVFLAIKGAWLAVGTNALAALFIIHMFSTTYYRINGNTLQIKCGLLINTTIDISSIKQVLPTKSIASSPALSIDRLLIKYNTYDEIIISPKDKILFINSLKTLNPTIVS